MTGELGGAIGIALFLAFFVKAALDRVATVIRAKWPTADLGVPFGIAGFALGGALGWLANVNVLASIPIDPLLGRALTAIAVGLGVEFLNDVLATVQGRRGTDVIVSSAGAAQLRVVGLDAAEEPDGNAPEVLRVRRIGPPVRGW